jgi:hypothetical protein
VCNHWLSWNNGEGTLAVIDYTNCMPFTPCDYKNNHEMQITKKDLNNVE